MRSGRDNLIKTITLFRGWVVWKTVVIEVLWAWFFVKLVRNMRRRYAAQRISLRCVSKCSLLILLLNYGGRSAVLVGGLISLKTNSINLVWTLQVHLLVRQIPIVLHQVLKLMAKTPLFPLMNGTIYLTYHRNSLLIKFKCSWIYIYNHCVKYSYINHACACSFIVSKDDKRGSDILPMNQTFLKLAWHYVLLSLKHYFDPCLRYI